MGELAYSPYSERPGFLVVKRLQSNTSFEALSVFSALTILDKDVFSVTLETPVLLLYKIGFIYAIMGSKHKDNKNYLGSWVKLWY